MNAWYNEIDPFAAAWLRELIKAGHIAPGEVDERSITEVQPEDLQGFGQCHFFAGIGVWSHALRAAGWPDDTPVWTGSCPCQSFSASGKRGGFDDPRHLWPAWFRLISECRPDAIFGEQVASRDGLAWFDLVSSDLEGAGYALGAADLCAAGFGAPHIRQRLYFVAESNGLQPKQLARSGSRPGEAHSGRPCSEPPGRSEIGRLADAAEPRRTGAGEHGSRPSPLPARLEQYGELADAEPRGQRRGRPSQESTEFRTLERPKRLRTTSEPADSGEFRIHNSELRILSGFWSSAEWLWCRDQKYRPVEPGTFPLAHGAAKRVGRLRGYGNALCAPVAQAFIRTCIESMIEDGERRTKNNGPRTARKF